MALADIITAFKTGTYSVTRYGAGSYSTGYWSPGSTSSLSIDACVQPFTGKDLKVLPEGRRADEVKVIYTKTLLRTAGPSVGADRVTIGSDTYEVFHVEPWESHYSTTFYRVLASRVMPSGGP